MPDTLGPERESAVLDAVPTGLFIGGSWRPAASGATLSVDDPATGKTLVEVGNAGPEDGRAALDAAVAAQPGFAAMPPTKASPAAATSSPTLSSANTRFSSGTTVARLSAVSR